MSNIRFSAERGEDSKYGMRTKCALHSGQYLNIITVQWIEHWYGTVSLQDCRLATISFRKHL